MIQADRVQGVRNKLLGPTLNHVVRNSRFYRGHIGSHVRHVETVDDLAILPTVNKQAILENIDDVLCSPHPGDMLTYSSGTTGAPFVVRRSPQETQEHMRFQRVCVQNSSIISKRKRILEIYSPAFHGFPIASPPENVVRISTPEDRAHYEWIQHLLHSEISHPTIESHFTVLRLGFRRFLDLTAYFLQEGIDPKEFGLVDIALSGFYVSQKWRDFLAKTWNANIIDSYSMSEFPNPTALCPSCGYVHFVLPTLIPEIIDPFTHKPVGQGCGILTLTSLYPFTQRQPFIRYMTGDLVERGPRCINDVLGFRIRGRFHECLVIQDEDSKAQLLLSALDVHDVLDAIPEVNCSDPKPHPILKPYWLQMISHKVISSLRLERVKNDCYQIFLSVALNFIPGLYPQRAQQIRDLIEQELRRKSPYLRKLTDGGRAELVIQLCTPDKFRSKPLVDD